jgi:hypothetical protein
LELGEEIGEGLAAERYFVEEGGKVGKLLVDQ